ncbi:hypothetical protein [uncultured Ruegeria sp.]|uniref:hypothetical protein n=1 Tax=uncultured Ruegeria sp. TaxID=259304 RepID=UPI0026344BA0|nr:hypothetical protein [uncultured Ruegeria sp.]
MLMSPNDSKLAQAAIDGSLPAIGSQQPKVEDALAASLAVWGVSEGSVAEAISYFNGLREAAITLDQKGGPKLLTAPMPRALLDSLGLHDHESAGANEDLAQALRDALKLLQDIEPHFFQAVIDGIDTLIPVQLREGAKARAPLTSITIPCFPMTSFFSTNALRHLAPGALTEQDDIAVLAENLLHESIHQRVNLTIIEKRVLRPDFSSENSPKIPIPWRQTATEARNREWELDRCLHAFAVYVGVYPFRKAVAERRNVASSTRQTFLQSLDQAKKSMRFLGQALTERRHLFDQDGQDLILELQAANPFAVEGPICPATS